MAGGGLSRTLLKGGCVLSLDRKVGNFQRADVLIDGATIAAVGPDLRAGNAETLDATDTIVMPGFVDTHRHVWECLFRNLGDHGPIRDGDPGALSREIGPAYRPEDVYAGNLVGLLSAIDAGITTLLDWSHVQATPEHTDAAIAAHREAGIRAVFAYGVPWWSDADRNHAERIRRLAGAQFSTTDQLLTLALALAGPEFAPMEANEADWALAREVGARISVHVGVGKYGRRGKLAEMARAGLLGPDTTYVNCATLSDEEIGMIADSGGWFSLAAQAGMMNGYGMPPIQQLLDRQLKPSLSVDAESNVPTDMFTQMRAVISIQHASLFDLKLAGKGGVPNLLTTRRILEFATIEGARANGLGDVTGTLTPGKQADIIVLRTDRPNIHPVNDPIGAVVWGMDTSNVDSVFVAGRALKRDGELVGVDMNRVGGLAYEARDHVARNAGMELPAVGALR
jgi:cytosine/adenosine deaminase-related metal-dependent hydrolase